MPRGLSSSSMIRLGGHGLPVASEDVEAFARAHVAFGYGAAYCPRVEISDAQRLSDIERAFGKAGVTIAEVGDLAEPHNAG